MYHFTVIASRAWCFWAPGAFFHLLRVPRVTWHTFINYIDWSTRSDRRRWWWYRTELAVGPFERARSLFFRTVLVEFSRFCPEKPLQKQNGLSEKNVFVCFRTEKASAHANRLFITKLPLIIGAVLFYGEAELTVSWGIDMCRKSQIVTKVTIVTFVTIFEFVTSDPYLCPTKTVNSASP